MTRDNITATISSSVTENVVCWLRWPQDAQQPCPQAGRLIAGNVCGRRRHQTAILHGSTAHLPGIVVIVGIQLQ
jgi:hypothetical protein